MLSARLMLVDRHPCFTGSEIDWVINQVARWAEVKALNENPCHTEVYTHIGNDFRNVMIQVGADAHHSMLLRRLLLGEDPFPEPPGG